MRNRGSLLRYLMTVGVSLAGWGSLALANGQVAAPGTGSFCKVSEHLSLYLGHDGDDLVTTLEPDATFVLRVTHPSRWLVKTAKGQLGFVTKADLQGKAECEDAPASPPTDSVPSETRNTPQLEASDIAEVAEALELTKAKVEGVAIGEDVLAEQTAKVARVAESRDAARRGEDRVTSRLIRVAVYDFELLNVARSLGSATTEALLEEIRKLEGVSAIGMDEIRELLDFQAQRQAMGLDCEADDACFAEIAGALGVDEIITGKLTEEADGRILLIKRIDQRRAQVIQSHTQRLKIGSGEEFLLAVGPATEKLYPKRDYRPGTTPGVPERLVLRLNPPPIPRLVTESVGWAALGALVAGGAGYGIAWIQNDAYRSDLVSSRRGTMAGDDAASLQSSGRFFERSSYGLFIGSATLAAVYGALFAITDWDGLSEEGEEDHDEHGH